MSASRLRAATFPKCLPGLLALALLVLAAPGLPAQTHCSETSSDGSVTVEVRIDSPEPYAFIAAGPPCPDSLPVTGIASAVGIPPTFDVFVVVDASGSTGACTGVDVDGDTIVGETTMSGVDCSDRGDSIYQAEVEAVARLVDVLDLSRARIGIISFSDPNFHRLILGLTDDAVLINAAVDFLRTRFPFGSTDFEGAQDLTRIQFLISGDPTRAWMILFLSDGSPTWPEPPTCCLPTTAGDTRASIEAAQRVGGAGIVMHTYAVGAQANRNILRAMANHTGGQFFAFNNPGDVVDILPTSVLTGINLVMVENLTLNEVVRADMEPLGDFSADIAIAHGWNDLLVTAQAYRMGNLQVPCPVSVYFACGRGCAPNTQGFWHHQCKAVGEIGNDSGTPRLHVEEFEELQGIVDMLLAHTGQTTCQALDADPSSDPCERALKQYAAFLLNVAEGRLGAACSLDENLIGPELDPGVDPPATVEEMMGLLDRLLREGLAGDPDRCKDVNDLADLVNTGQAVGVPGPSIRLLIQPVSGLVPAYAGGAQEGGGEVRPGSPDAGDRKDSSR